MKKSAFTLVELLVVISIIAVLAGLVFPIFGRVQEQSRTAKCASNLRQVGAGLLAYAGEHNGVLPLSGGSIDYVAPNSRTSATALGWTEQIEPYAGTDRKIFTCPSSSLTITQNIPYSYFQGAHAAYVANSGFAALRLSLVQYPSKYILGGDISDAIFDPGQAATDSDKDDFTQDPAFDTTPVTFHGGRVNLVFADGHVGAYAAFDPHVMTTQYGLKSDGTGYLYTDPAPASP